MPADRSHTEFVRRRRAVAQAVRRSTCRTCPELGPAGPTDSETVMSRHFGQSPYIRQTATGLKELIACCPQPQTIQIIYNFRVIISFSTLNPSMSSSTRINDFIAAYSALYGINPALLTVNITSGSTIIDFRINTLPSYTVNDCDYLTTLYADIIATNYTQLINDCLNVITTTNIATLDEGGISTGTVTINTLFDVPLSCYGTTVPPTTEPPTTGFTTEPPTTGFTTEPPTTEPPTTGPPTTGPPTTSVTTGPPTTSATTAVTTGPPTTELPTTIGTTPGTTAAFTTGPI